MKRANPWPRRLVVLVLFGALVVLLLWFQGVLFRSEHPPAHVPGAPAAAAGARTARVEERVLPGVRVHSGFVEAVDPAQLAPRVMATVLSVAGREGDAVEQGQVVVELDDRDARARLSQAEAGLGAAAAQLLQARLAFERAERLHGADALTTQEWEAARAAHDGARAQEERAREMVEEARAALSWYRLTAPFAGRILERRVDPGDLAAPGRPIVALYRADRLRFRVAVPEERAAELEPGREYDVTFDRLPPRRARLSAVLPAADPGTGTVTLRLELADAADLRPGLFGRLQLAVGERAALVVPVEAVERIGQVERVRLLRDGRVVPVTVRTGKRQDGLVEVQSGLAAGEEVLLP